jgi:hypothetical protein
MGEFEDVLRASIDEASRKMTEARLAGDHNGTEAYRERLGFLRRVARRHGLGPWPYPEPASPARADDEAGPDLARAGGPAPRAAG